MYIPQLPEDTISTEIAKKMRVFKAHNGTVPKFLILSPSARFDLLNVIQYPVIGQVENDMFYGMQIALVKTTDYIVEVG